MAAALGYVDGINSYVDCEFTQGKLTRWQLQRPLQPGADALPSTSAEPVA